MNSAPPQTNDASRPSPPTKEAQDEVGGHSRPTNAVPELGPSVVGARATALVVVREEAGLAEHVPAWQELARCPLEPNAFQEPWLVLSALRAFGAGQQVRFLFAYGPTDPPSKKRVLLGVFPLLPPRRLAPLLPAGVVTSWRHVYCFLSTPLVHAQRGGEALRALLEWLRTDREGAPLWRLELVGAEGPFARLLTQTVDELHRPSFVVDSYCRAIIEVKAGDGDAYLKLALPHKRLKEYRRLERRLGERGRLERRVLEAGGDLSAWVEAFLNLEASGWKGKEGTAFQARPADAAFFREMARGAFERGRLQMLGLFLDGRPVALKCNLMTPPGSFAFKIAFDESFARHSPGVLLELANVEHLHAARPVEWMDSCVNRVDHTMINRLWRERRAVRTLLVATGRAPGDLVVSLFPLARWLKRKFRRPGKPKPPEAQE
jgi:hypothetical protein